MCAKQNKNSCKKYKKCSWHDHYIKCYPINHIDSDQIFCDVRNDNNPDKPSRYKCKLQKYKQKCKWNKNKRFCVPK